MIQTRTHTHTHIYMCVCMYHTELYQPRAGMVATGTQLPTGTCEWHLVQDMQMSREGKLDEGRYSVNVDLPMQFIEDRRFDGPGQTKVGEFDAKV